MKYYPTVLTSEVNGGRTMADWERFLRASESSFLSGTGSFQPCVAATEDSLLHHEPDSFDSNTASLGEEEATSAADDPFSTRTLDEILQNNSKSSNKTTREQLQSGCVTDSHEDTELGDGCHDVSEPVIGTGSSTMMVSQPIRNNSSKVVTSAPISQTTRRALLSSTSSDVNCFPASVNSCSSVYANNDSDGAIYVDSDDSIGEIRSPQPSFDISEHQVNESTESVESSSASANMHTLRKRFLNRFRNPWHTHSTRRAPIPFLGMGARSIGSDGPSDSGGASNHASLFLLRPYCFTDPLSRRRFNFDEVSTDTEQTRNSDDSGTEDATENRSTVADQNSRASPTGEYPVYGRGSPDGLSSGQSIASSTQSLSSDEIVIVNDSDPEMQSMLMGPTREGVLLHLDQTVESLPASILSISSNDSSTQSWESGSVGEQEEESREMALALALPVPEEILGMLPAGYRQSDDNLFGQRQEEERAGQVVERMLNQLTEQESEWMRAHHPVPRPLPEERDLPAGSAPYLTSTTSAISALECPVCFTYMSAPIWLCVNGHNVCGRCQQRVFSCPVCRGRLLFTRNLALEAIAADLSFQSMKEGRDSDPQKPDVKVLSVEVDVCLPDESRNGGSPNAGESLPNNELEERDATHPPTTEETNSSVVIVDEAVVNLGHEQSAVIDSSRPKSPTSI